MPGIKTTEIRNIIFDLGGVLLNINPLLSLNEFAIQSGIPQEELKIRLANERVFEKFDTGSISPEEFRNALCGIMGKKVNDAEIDRAWNLLLLDFPPHRVQLLQLLRKNYRIYLLSNTNSIHFRHYTKEFYEKHALQMTDLFDTLYLSYEIGLHKPDAGIYTYVLQNAGLNPSECIFIDDSLVNVKAAAKPGIAGIHITSELDVTDFFEFGKLKPNR